MLIAILIIALILAFIFTTNPTIKFHLGYGAIFFVIAAWSTGMLIANQNNHVGMKKVATSETQTIKSVSPKMDMLLYKNHGNGKEKVYIYDNKKTTKADTSTKITVKKADVKYASVTVKKYRYDYASGMDNMLYAMIADTSTITNRHYIFTIPNSWIVLSTDQGAQLQKVLKQKQSQIKAEVQKKLMAAMMKNPKLSKKEQTAIINQVKAQVIKEAIAEVQK
ncbi:MAG: DUF4811 domain-containing protein [Lactobacillus sp.]|nr:DUF4811 domain-containing protein [Lactobacillus sp.]